MPLGISRVPRAFQQTIDLPPCLIVVRIGLRLGLTRRRIRPASRVRVAGAQRRPWSDVGFASTDFFDEIRCQQQCRQRNSDEHAQPDSSHKLLRGCTDATDVPIDPKPLTSSAAKFCSLRREDFVREMLKRREVFWLTHELAPDVVLLDLRLTDMPGMEVCARLKGHPRATGVPVIVVTSQQLSAVERARLSDAHAVLSKSFLTRDVLRTAIQNAISRSPAALAGGPS